MNHSGALAHASKGHARSAHLNLNRSLLGAGIRGHNGLCRKCSGLKRILPGPGKLSYSRLDPVYGKLHADHPGGGHQHGALRNSKLCGRCRCRPLAVGIDFPSGARIGNPRIDNHRLPEGRLLHHLLVPEHGGRLHHVAGKGSRSNAGCLAVDHCHILPVLIFDSRFRACRLKAFCRSHSSCYDLHCHSSVFRAIQNPACLFAICCSSQYFPYLIQNRNSSDLPSSSIRLCARKRCPRRFW